MRSEKDVVRQAKEVGLYSHFHKLSCELKSNGVYNEFMNLVRNEHTLGLMGFFNKAKPGGPFDHVLDWMLSPTNERCILYDNELMNYEDFLVLQNG